MKISMKFKPKDKGLKGTGPKSNSLTGKLKKFFPFLIGILVIIICVAAGIAFFTSDTDEVSEKELISNKISAYVTDLEDSSTTMNSPQAVAYYLATWAETKGISCKIDENYNVIMNIKATTGYKKADPTVVLCSYDSTQFSNNVVPMGIAMYTAKNSTKTGPLSVIFINDEGHRFQGIKKLSKKYFTDKTNVFCVNPGSSNQWSLSTGARSSYRFAKKVSKTSPEGNKALKITISGLPGGIPDSDISSYPNPIKTISNLLASCNTNSYTYELAKIRGGSSGNLYPKSASATIVINENDLEKFTSKLDSSIENFNDKYAEYFPDARYSYKEVKMPKTVFTNKSCGDFVSILYTLLDGKYHDGDESEAKAITNIGAIKHKGNIYSIYATANSSEGSVLNEIDTSYLTLCGFSRVKYHKTGSQLMWSCNETSPFVDKISLAFRLYSGKTLTYKDTEVASNTSYVRKLNDKCNVVNLSVNSERAERYAGTISTYLKNLNEKEQ